MFFRGARAPRPPPPRGCAPARRYGRLGLDHRFYVGVVITVQLISAPAHSRKYIQGCSQKNWHISFIIFTDPNDARMTLRISNDSAFHGNLISRRLNYTIPTSLSRSRAYSAWGTFRASGPRIKSTFTWTAASALITAATGQPRCQNIVEASAQSLSAL